MYCYVCVVAKWMDGWMDGRMEGRTNRLDGLVDGGTGERVGGWVGE